MNAHNATQRRKFLQRAGIAAALAALTLQPLGAFAQSGAAWPARPLRLIAGYPAGSSPDVQARLVAEHLTKALGVAVVVENKPGAGGNIGADLIAKADDGHTIGIIGNGPLTSAKFLYTKLPYDPAKDFAPIVLVGSAPLVWVAPKAAVTGSVADYIKAVKAAGNKVNYGSIGAGSGGHLGMELINEKLGLQAVHIPFAGGPAILNGMLGGEIQITLLPGSTVAPLVQSGKLAAIAVTSSARSPLTPDLPSMTEIGAQGINIEVWNAIMAPAKMPAEHQAKLNAELAKILQGKEVKEKLLTLGWKVEDTSAKALADRIRSDTALYGALISAKGYKLD
ncbi:MAG: tripartite tricarboxylate transporter substrate binding protein [Betaproteobacteria bacterium]|nr:tripartite tricarboxylate transporter substrate binding protein [Betaproteobacteria bacterium]